MAFLREYELRGEDTLILYFYMDSKYSKPSLIIRLDVRTHEMHVTPSGAWFSTQILADEVRRLLDFIELPYWRSCVRLCTPDHRYINGVLY